MPGECLSRQGSDGPSGRGLPGLEDRAQTAAVLTEQRRASGPIPAVRCPQVDTGPQGGNDACSF